MARSSEILVQTIFSRRVSRFSFPLCSSVPRVFIPTENGEKKQPSSSGESRRGKKRKLVGSRGRIGSRALIEAQHGSVSFGRDSVSTITDTSNGLNHSISSRLTTHRFAETSRRVSRETGSHPASSTAPPFCLVFIVSPRPRNVARISSTHRERNPRVLSELREKDGRNFSDNAKSKFSFFRTSSIL